MPVSAIFEAPTIEKLAEYIKRKSSDQEFTPLIGLQTYGSKKPIFAAHPGDGNVFCYTDLVRQLGNEQPFYGFQAYGVEEGTKAINSLEEMARIYIKEMKKIQPEGSYIIFGYCAGGTLAFEMAQQLKRDGEIVEMLVLFDARASHTYSPMDEVGNFMAFARNFEGISNADLFGLYCEVRNIEKNDARIGEDLKMLTLQERFHILWKCSQELGIIPADVSAEYLERLFNVWLGLSGMMTYDVKTYDGKMVLFRAADDHINKELNLYELGWNKASKSIEIFNIPGNHFTMLKLPNVKHITEPLKNLLDEIK